MRPISPDNVSGPLAVSPDGRFVVGATRDDHSCWLFPIADGDSPVRLPQIQSDESPMRWSADGKALFLRRRGGEMPLRITRLELANGQRTLWKEITLADRTGVNVITFALISPDGAKVVIVFTRVLSDLFVFSGLR